MDFYREEILEHWRNPQNWGVMDSADSVIDQINPLCGDRLTLYIKLSTRKANGQRRIADIRFTGNGCAVSIASASILSENIKNKSSGEISKLKGEDVLEMIGGSVAPARLKCAFLALEAVRKLKI